MQNIEGFVKLFALLLRHDEYLLLMFFPQNSR